MSMVDRIKTKFRVTVTPNINDVDDNEPLPDSAQNIPFNITPSSSINEPQATKIKLRSDWTIVASHPTFQQEYKDYIRNDSNNSPFFFCHSSIHF
jgi:hypothetical protein